MLFIDRAACVGWPKEIDPPSGESVPSVANQLEIALEGLFVGCRTVARACDTQWRLPLLWRGTSHAMVLIASATSVEV